jgi:hypothetical protein
MILLSMSLQAKIREGATRNYRISHWFVFIKLWKSYNMATCGDGSDKFWEGYSSSSLDVNLNLSR